MHLSQSDLLLAWLGGGFVLFLAWAAVVGEVMVRPEGPLIRPALALLTVIGLVHPAAAIAATDLVRLSVVHADEGRPAVVPGWAVAASRVALAVSLVVAVGLWSLAEPAA